MSANRSLAEIRSEINRLASQINAPAELLPTFGYSEDGARPHIEVNAVGYHYVVVERGQEISRVTTNELDELLYHVFEFITFELACKYELKHRVVSRDSRRLIFKHQIDLLAELSTRWSERKAQEHERILQQHPYDDYAVLRADLAKALRVQGISPELAWKTACEKYPLP